MCITPPIYYNWVSRPYFQQYNFALKFLVPDVWDFYVLIFSLCMYAALYSYLLCASLSSEDGPFWRWTTGPGRHKGEKKKKIQTHKSKKSLNQPSYVQFCSFSLDRKPSFLLNNSHKLSKLSQHDWLLHYRERKKYLIRNIKHTTYSQKYVDTLTFGDIFPIRKPGS